LAYLGNRPAEAYSAFQKQDFSTSATTSYTLDHPVSNQNEIALFINFVRQEPTTAYTASGTTLTLTSATASSDDMYCIYLGKAVQTVNPPSGSVGTAQLADSSVSLAKLSATGTKDSTTFLRGDNTFTSAGGTTAPYCSVYRNGDQNLSDNTLTVIEFNVENVDSASAFDTSTYRFTPQTSGYYFVSLNVGIGNTADNSIDKVQIKIFKNGSTITGAVSTRDWDANAEGLNYNDQINTSVIVQMNGSSDYIDGRALVDVTSGTPRVESQQASMHIFKMTE